MKNTTMLFMLLLILLFSAHISLAGDLLESKHADIGCVVCHDEEKPASAPGSHAVCMDCHGDHAAIIALTAKSKPNWHEAAHSEVPGLAEPCLNCHKMHKPSALSCVKCHDEIKSVSVP